MKLRILTLQTLMRFAKLCAGLMGIWPLSADGGRYEALQRNVVWSSAMFIAATSDMVIIYAIFRSPDLLTCIELLSEVAVVSGVVVKLLIFKANNDSLQMLFVELEDFLQKMSREENEFFQNYLQKYTYSHFGYALGCITAPVTFVGVSIVLWGEWLPGTSDYPVIFGIAPNWAIMFVHQAWVSWLVGCMGTADLLLLSMLWTVTARFEMLGREYTQATSIPAFERCIEKQQILMNHSKRLCGIVRWVVLLSNSMTLSNVTFGGFFIILQTNMTEIVSFLIMLSDVIFELFLYTWAGERLMESSSQVGFAAYSSDWVGAPAKLLMDMRFVMKRSTNPEVISVDGLIPPLGLEYFGSAMSMIFSYIATLRAIMAE